MRYVLGAALVTALIVPAALDAKSAAPFSLAVNAKKHGVRQTASGLQYRIIKPGQGSMPTTADVALVNYVGRLTDGVKFDASTAPVRLPLNKVVPGFAEGLALMRKGATYRFWIPAALGYGAKDVRDDAGKVIIPANSILVFDVTLIDFSPDSGAGETETPAPQ